jgi:aminopeptidase-like protein/aminoglycoside N3'-acetyltransferase
MNLGRQIVPPATASDSGPDYSHQDLVTALRKVDIGAGDVVFAVVGLGTLGTAQDSASPAQVHESLFGALREVVGEKGTILVPTYTFSFCRGEIFDLENTPSAKGPWSPSTDFLEYVRQLPGAVRSADPVHSVVGLGPKAAEILLDVAPTCFGKDSFFHRLRKLNGKICAVGVPLQESNFQHHVEEMVGVPFRYKKLFTGYVRSRGRTEKKGWIYNVGLLSKNGQVDGDRLEKLAREAGLCRAARLGQGEVLGVDSAALFDLASKSLAADPWFTARGPAGDAVKLEQARVAGPRHKLALSTNASMEEMIHALWRLPRDIVSEGYDAALHAMATQLPMQIHEFPTGTECWSWIIPEKWTCHEAWLETLDGRRLFSYADHPLHVVSYSLPFEGEVSRSELFEHLHVHWKIPDAIPFIFKYYERDWGLCCSKKLKDTLTDERYRVKIRTDFSYGTLKVGEVVVPGKTEDCIVLCAHLCHPAMVNDDLSGVVVGMKVMQELRRRADLRYTYRFLILPETIGSVAYLSHNEHLIPKMKGGLFLEMLGLDYPHALQLSLSGKTEMDLCVTAALRSHDPHAWIGDYRTVVGNDERQFNGPGVRVPMLSLSRVLPGKVCDSYYPEYHSSYDTPELASVKRLEQSLALVLKIVDTLEQNIVPVNWFKGEVFCSRYGLFIDPYTNPEGNEHLFSIMDLIDGSRSIAEIAAACNTSFEAVSAIVAELTRCDLVDCR